jgi:ABC-type multidrug transport system ATPase subunit
MNELHVDSVIKFFGKKIILSDIYLSCKKGEVVALLGRNGSGKSVLMKIIFGSLSADNKFVRVDDKLIHNLFDNRHIISYLPQSKFLPSNFTVETLINLFCSRTDAEVIKTHKLISPTLKRRGNMLSTGERRMIEIFMMVYADSKFTLLDEPFNGVAPIYIEEIKQIIKEQSEHKGFIITDHDYRNVLDLATKTILLYDGGTKVIKNREKNIHRGYIPR